MTKHNAFTFQKLAKLTFLGFALLCFISMAKQEKPVLYIIGDSTVQNSDGNGKNEYWGWGSLLKAYLDTNRIAIENHAKAGTSTRTFILDGRWDKILAELKKGDFVIMQFGHNDHSGVDDPKDQRGTLLGAGDSTRVIISRRTNQEEIVHTYGWYLQKFITEAKAKGAIPITCSLVPRNKWKNGGVVVEAAYPKWTEEIAKKNNTYYINLNSIVASKWKTLGTVEVKTFFPVDGTHTNLKGAQLNAAAVVEGLKGLKSCPLNLYLKENK
ncbi:rhamnogalacturonan acetylesterase [Pedobacter frigiditerrae]|uniref:rhamnogalacturonan acetylesterase n=1 Tax=Pedobacter frigiditerrae TaxID=2530452 RepID=UPI00292FD6B2|nr:rhamnogalacturonan acetylesterase [Pedobacter frigiditerrae]